MRNSPFFSSLLAYLWQRLSGQDEQPAAGVVALGGTDTLLRFAGPAVNVDGTPMLDGVVDVMGKLYGDNGSAFCDEPSMFDTGMHRTDW